MQFSSQSQPSRVRSARALVATAVLMAAAGTSAAQAVRLNTGARAFGQDFDGGTFGLPQITAFAQSGGQFMQSNSFDGDFVANSSVTAFSRYGFGRIDASMNAALSPPPGNPNRDIILGGMSTGSSGFGDRISFEWEAGFDDTQPINVRFFGRAVIPSGDAITINPSTGFRFDGRFGLSPRSGVVTEGPDMSFSQSLTNIAVDGLTETSDWVLNNGGEMSITGAFTVTADLATSVLASNPAGSVPSTSVAATAIWQFYLEVPDGVAVLAESNHDYSLVVIPAVPSGAVLGFGVVVATRRRRR